MFTDCDYREWNTALLQISCDFCDVLNPATALGLTSFDDGIIGLAGTMSSLIGIYNVWEKCRP
jgi:peroxin-11B